MMKKPKEDVILRTNVGIFEKEMGKFRKNKKKESVLIGGDLSVGKAGNPITIVVIDELTGEMVEIEHVKNALLVIEDVRPNSNGWLTLLSGDLNKISEILRLLAKTTFEELSKVVFGGTD